MWAFMEGWFTPSSLFIFLNLVIGTIFLTSRLTSPRKPDHHHVGPSDSPPLARAPSLLERVKSMDFSLYKFGHYPQPETAQHEHDYDHRVDAPPLARAPSLLDRFKSINFSLYKFDHPADYPETDPVPVQGSYPEPQYSHPDDSPPLQPPLARAPSLADRFKSFDFSFYKSHAPSYAQPQAYRDEHSLEPEYADRDEPPRLARAPSLLERVKSINFSSFYKSSEPDPDADALHHLEDDSDSEDDYDLGPYGDGGRVHRDHQVRRIRSEPKTAFLGEAPARLPAKMKKSASERSTSEGEQKTGTAVALQEEGEEIDAKADAFINRFKQHLQLQRLDSIMRFEEMLGRGAS